MAFLPSDHLQFPLSRMVTDSTTCDPGRHYRNQPSKHPRYASAQQRMRSFTGWPTDRRQTPFLLSKAGFFYAGADDNVKCFHCGGGLKNWLPGNDPMVEHARWFSGCGYVREQNGDYFVDHVKETQTQSPGGEELRTEGDPKAADFTDIVQRILKKPCGVSIVEMFSMSVAVAAITKVLSNVDWEEQKVTVAELANAAIELQEDQEKAEAEQVDTNTAVTAKLPALKSESLQKNDKESLLEENDRLKDQLICKVCRTNSVSCVFLPCGHFVTCFTCAPSVDRCVLCNGTIATSVKVYV